jgi:hypothetical protein
MKIVRSLACLNVILALAAPYAVPLSAGEKETDHDNRAPFKQVEIASAAADAAQTTLIVHGSNFSPSSRVHLAGIRLSGIVVTSGGTELLASLPPAFLPGSYQLQISKGPAAHPI